MMNNKAEADSAKAQPVTIKVAEWDTVAEDVAAGRCVVEEVLHDEDGIEKRYLVTMIMPRKNNVYDVVYPWFTSVNVEPEKEFTVRWLSTPQPAPDAGEAFVNPTRAYEETLSRDELLKRLDDQARVIHELYTGKHGVIPHPAEVWQPGLWEVYRVGEHQGHAERVGDVGELAASSKREAALREALEVAIKATENQRKQKLTYGIALEKIVAKSDPERPEKLDGEDSFSFGITRGLWRAGVIAREALEQAAALQAAGESEEA